MSLPLHLQYAYLSYLHFQRQTLRDAFASQAAAVAAAAAPPTAARGAPAAGGAAKLREGIGAVDGEKQKIHQPVEIP